jgi:branched-chain amino acid transport system permease protein
LGLGIVVSVGFTELAPWTGGPNGVTGIPPLEIAGFALTTDKRFFFAAWLMCALTYWVASNLVHSPTGLRLRGLGESERAAGALGTNVAALKRSVLMLSAAMAALAGGLYAHYIGFISPQPFGTGFSIRLLLMIAVGGFQSLPGVLLGVAFVTIVTEPLQHLGYFDVVVFGIVLVLVMIFFPRGLFVGLLDMFRGPRLFARFTRERL